MACAATFRASQIKSSQGVLRPQILLHLGELSLTFTLDITRKRRNWKDELGRDAHCWQRHGYFSPSPSLSTPYPYLHIIINIIIVVVFMLSLWLLLLSLRDMG